MYKSLAFTCDPSNNWAIAGPTKGKLAQPRWSGLEADEPSALIGSEGTGGRKQEHLLLDFDIERRRGAASMDHCGPG